MASPMYWPVCGSSPLSPSQSPHAPCSPDLVTPHVHVSPHVRSVDVSPKPGDEEAATQQVRPQQQQQRQQGPSAGLGVAPTGASPGSTPRIEGSSVSASAVVVHQLRACGAQGQDGLQPSKDGLDFLHTEFYLTKVRVAGGRSCPKS
jgi:hypothetical protein